MLALLADERKAGRLEIDPVGLWSGGECLPPSVRAEIEAAFGCPVVNEYGASECMSIAFGCDEGWLHVNADWVAARAGRRRPSADAAGRTVADGAAHQPRQPRAADHPLRPRRQRRRQPRAVRVREPAAGDPGRGQARRRAGDDRTRRAHRAPAAARADDGRRGRRAGFAFPDRADRRRTGCSCASIAGDERVRQAAWRAADGRCAAISSGSRCPTCASASTSAARAPTGAAAKLQRSRRVRRGRRRQARSHGSCAHPARGIMTACPPMLVRNQGDSDNDRHHGTSGCRSGVACSSTSARASPGNRCICPVPISSTGSSRRATVRRR